MSPKNMQLSAPVNVRLPVEVAEEIKEESIETGVPESVIIRRAVLAGRRNGVFSVSADSSKHVEDTKTMQNAPSAETPTPEVHA